MLGFVAKFGSSKGMVPAPNLSGLNRGQAIAAIQSAGLVFGGNAAVQTSNSSLNDFVQSQAIAAGTLVDYESSLSFGYYVYVAPAVVVTYDPCQDTTPVVNTDDGCSNCNRTTTTTTPQRQAKKENGVIVSYVACPSVTTTSVKKSDTTCPGCEPPPAKVCVASESWDGPWSAGCSDIGAGGGVNYRYKTYVRTDCSTYTQEFTRNCCAAGCGSWSRWSGSAGAYSRTRTCVKTDCSTYIETENKCDAKSETVCGACSKKSPFRKSCTTYTVTASCGTSSAPAPSQAC
jgi:hypothetical protein